MQLLSYSSGYVDVLFEAQFSFNLNEFYGNLVTHVYRQSWEVLNLIGAYKTKLWLCFGDFNELIYSYEKDGLVNMSPMQMCCFPNQCSGYS